jgi:asparagine synthase (glutamine-hydrolysing)
LVSNRPHIQPATLGFVFVDRSDKSILIREMKAKGHKFRTNSDTEAIVHAYEEWGNGAVKKLRGMFAFAVWDENKQQLFLGRDRLGKKPLYYVDDPDRFALDLKSRQSLSCRG